MALVTHSKKDKQYGFAEQIVFGTAIDDTAAFQEMDCEDTTIVADVKNREVSGSHGTRNMTYADVTTDEKGAMPAITIVQEAKEDELDFMLHAFFQNVVEGVGTPFSKTFTLPQIPPDLSVITALDDPGQLLTFIERYTIANQSTKIKDCICKSLVLTLPVGERLKLSANFVGRGLTDFTSDPSGTFTREEPSHFHFEDLARFTIDFGGGAQVIVPTGDTEIKLAADVLPVGADGSGNFQNFAYLLNRVLEFSLVINRDAQVVTAKANWVGDIPITVNFAWGNASPGTVDGDLDFTFTGKIDKVEENNDDVSGAVITGKILAPIAATAPITIIMANDLDRSWTV